MNRKKFEIGLLLADISSFFISIASIIIRQPLYAIYFILCAIFLFFVFIEVIKD